MLRENGGLRGSHSRVVHRRGVLRGDDVGVAFGAGGFSDVGAGGGSSFGGPPAGVLQAVGSGEAESGDGVIRASKADGGGCDGQCEEGEAGERLCEHARSRCSVLRYGHTIPSKDSYFHARYLVYHSY